MHNPFCGPFPEDEALVATDPGSARSLQYDLVCNAGKLAAAVYARTAGAPGADLADHGLFERADSRAVGHMLEAFSYGVPPHGGIAMGLDRTIAIFADEENIREAIAFPKNQQRLT